MNAGEKMFIVYDGRAIYGDTDDASVLVTERTLKAAINSAGMFGQSAIYEYTSDGQYLQDERMVAWTNPDGTVGWQESL